MGSPGGYLEKNGRTEKAQRRAVNVIRDAEWLLAGRMETALFKPFAAIRKGVVEQE